MVIAWPRGEYEGVGLVEGTPWSRVEKTQRHPRLPCLLVPQPAHAVLAGDLAGALFPESFGELPPEIRQAISMHDTGWAMSDAAQLQNLRGGSPQGAKPAIPVSFIAASPGEATKAWTASIEYVEGLSAVGAWIVSRHFTLLASPAERAQEKFLVAEEARRRRIQAKIAVAPGDPERHLGQWTAALGFCDLLSLYLLAGLGGPVFLPLAHPSSPQATSAPRVTLELEGSLLRFTPRIFPAGFQVQLDALRHPIGEQGSRTEKLVWEVA